LTIKLTRHIAASPQASSSRRWPVAQPQSADGNLTVLAILLIARSWFRVSSFTFQTASHIRNRKLETRNWCSHTSRIEALIKFTYSLVDCPIYSVVKHRPLSFRSSPHSVGLHWVFQPNVRRQATVVKP
jgi:hypothetical protein